MRSIERIVDRREAINFPLERYYYRPSTMIAVSNRVRRIIRGCHTSRRATRPLGRLFLAGVLSLISIEVRSRRPTPPPLSPSRWETNTAALLDARARRGRVIVT